MVEEEIAQLSVTEFENVWDLIVSSTSIQIAFVILIVGMIGITVAYRRFSFWITSRELYYRRPHVSRFLRRAALPLFAIALITSINLYIQIYTFPEGVHGLSIKDTFAKILDTFNVLVVGYTVAHLIPIIMNKREKSELEESDFNAWFGLRGFVDDEGDLFHKLYRWVPPHKAPVDMGEKMFQDLLETKEGRERLERYRTSKGNPIGGYEALV